MIMNTLNFNSVTRSVCSTMDYICGQMPAR